MLLDSRVNSLENLTFKVTYYNEITTTSGQISPPTGATILLDQWSNGVDAVLSGIPGGAGTAPDFNDTGVDVTSFDTAGNYILNGALPTNPSALIYYISIELKNFNNLDKTKVVEYAEITLGNPVNYVEFNRLFGGTALPGQVLWNEEEGTIDLGLNSNVTLQLGQETAVLCRNDSGADIPNGTPVMFAGTVGNSGRIKIAPMLADGTYLSGYVVGLTTESISNGTDGYVTWFGKVRGIDTTGSPYGEVWNDGDIIYVSPTTTGGLTNVMPDSPNNNITIAAVVHAHSSGTLFVRPTWTQQLTALQDVNGTPLSASGQTLVWDNINKYFDFTENIYNYAKLNTDVQFQDVKSDCLILPKDASCGIKVDLTTPTFTWKDLIGDVTPKTFAVGSPSLTDFIGNVRGFAYSSGDDGDIVFHIPHDYLPGSDMYFHPHWGHNGTSISGTFEITYYFTYASRTLNNPAESFISQKVLTHTISGLNITNTPQYAHRVDEIQITSDGGSVSTLDMNDIEVDGLVILHYDVSQIPTISGGGSNEPFIFTLDIHYQSTGVLGTKSKDPDYYV